MKYVKLHIRNNLIRKNNSKKKKVKSHPVIVFGESDDGSKFYNYGLTTSPKRGRHKNLEIHNPKNWNEKSYVRDDWGLHDKRYLKILLKDYKLHPDDKKKIINLINKHKDKY